MVFVPPKKPLSPEWKWRLVVNPSDSLASPDSFAHCYVRSLGPLQGPAPNLLVSVPFLELNLTGSGIAGS